LAKPAFGCAYLVIAKAVQGQLTGRSTTIRRGPISATAAAVIHPFVAHSFPSYWGLGDRLQRGSELHAAGLPPVKVGYWDVADNVLVAATVWRGDLLGPPANLLVSLTQQRIDATDVSKPARGQCSSLPRPQVLRGCRLHREAGIAPLGLPVAADQRPDPTWLQSVCRPPPNTTTYFSSCVLIFRFRQLSRR